MGIVKLYQKNTYFFAFVIADRKSHALSIRDVDDKNEVVIKHYRIKTMDNGGCFISPKRTFTNILELIEHYKGKHL